MTERAVAPATAGPDLFAAVGRHFLLVLLPIVVLAGAGVGYGLARKPRYTADTKVSIGQLALTTQGIPGFLTAAGNLAAAYARAIDAPEVAAAAARAGGVSQQAAADALSASAIANTPLLLIEAVTTDKQRAIRMANAATDALIAHVLDLNRRANIRNVVLQQYKTAAIKVATLKLAVAKHPGSVSLRARLQLALLRQNALNNIYYASASGEVTQNLLQVIVRAGEASSDRNSTLGKWALIGALVGLLVGLALAAGRASALERRAASA